MKTSTAVRRKLPENAEARSHLFTINGREGRIVVSLYEDKTPGDVRIEMLRDSQLVQGLLNAMCLSVSIALQYGVPLKDIMLQFKGMKFEPSGFTLCPGIERAESIPDYVAQWFDLEFPPCYDCDSITVKSETGTWCPNCDQPSAPAQVATAEVPQPPRQAVPPVVADGPPCHGCGSPMVRADNGYRCANCGATSGLK